ncbi:MAG: pitrilysin family protein [Candidatus Gracilibacteria bacterium]|nr:insulinase family protein [Candidatus Peregrinibacteria bacterium]
MYKKTTFDNGLRVVTKSLESTQAVTVLILVGAGSRYETKEINGLSHFLEHMFFKGAKKYTNTKEVSEAIDSVGGSFNAFTGKEYVGYYVKVASKNQDTALDVLADMLLNSKFDPEEIDRERGVIMEEYNMYQDTPMQQIGWDFEELVYGDQPMGWDQVGTKEVIHSVTREDFIAYEEKLYSPDNIVISVAGDVDHDQVVEKIKNLFQFKDTKKQYQAHPVQDLPREKSVRLRNKKTEQGHLMLGVPGYPERHPDHYALKMLTIVLGGNMSSRMFLSVRERQGLAYYISTSSDDYSDTGTVSTNAGVSVDGIDQAITAILKEYKEVVDNPVDEKELHKAKEYLKGKLILRLEDSEEYAHLLGKYEVLYDEQMLMEKIFEEVDKVTVEDLQRVAKDLFKEDKLFLSVIGPYDDEERFAKLLKFE